MLEYAIGSILVCGALYIVASTLWGYHRIARTEFHNAQQPVLTRKVRVVLAKRHVRTGFGKHLDRRYVACAATFEVTDTHEQLKFAISEGEFFGMQEGQIGQLTHQGTKFINYQADV